MFMDKRFMFAKMQLLKIDTLLIQMITTQFVAVSVPVTTR